MYGLLDLKQLSVAIDLDNTIFNTYRCLCNRAEELHGKLEDDCTADHVKDYYNNHSYYGFKTNDEEMKYLVDKAECFEYAKDVLNKLIDEGVNIVLLTARNKNDCLWTLEQLRKHGIVFDSLIFNWDKVRYCKQNNIQLLIDDNRDTALSAIYNDIKVITVRADSYDVLEYDDSYGDLYSIVNNWHEVENILNDLAYL